MEATSAAATPATTPGEAEERGGIFWGLLRITIGWVFLWAFLDKLLGPGLCDRPQRGDGRR